jgi:hypothetical protein
MSDASAGPTCVFCGQSLPAGKRDCVACGASGQWQEYLRAHDFAQKRFDQWSSDRTIGLGPASAIAADFRRQREVLVRMARERRPLPEDVACLFANVCWNCRAELSRDCPDFRSDRGEAVVGENGTVPLSATHCPSCGVPTSHPSVQTLRYGIYTCQLVKNHCDAGRLPLAQAHACRNDAKARIAALRSNLEKERVSVSTAAPKTPPPVQPEPGPADSIVAKLADGIRSVAAMKPRQPLWEIILDPRSIQWLLGLGSVIFVIGLVIWLATLGIFENPVVVAVALGIANAVVLGGGWAMIRLTRYRTAGRAITLLACLVMPLNLWFYHANNLITLDGHLWVAALVCSALYMASALVLRDHVFVYVFNGGIALTGLLMLADCGRFWEIASPAAMLVVLGLIGLHVERAFIENDGPFSRKKFGLAFFYSGQVLLASGLLLVLGAQIAGDWLYYPIFQTVYESFHAGPPLIVDAATWGPYLALALVLAGSYGYFYSDMMVRRYGLYVYLGVFTFLWAEMLVIELVAHQVPAEAAIIVLALTGLAANLIQPKMLLWQKPMGADAKQESKAIAALSLVRAGQPLGLFLSTVPVLIGLVLHLRATYVPLNELWLLSGGAAYQVTWIYVIAMFITALSCRIGAHLNRHATPWLASVYFFGMAAATLTGLSGLLTVCGIKTWDNMAPLMMIVPIIYIVAARLYKGHSQENPLVWVAHTATGVMIAAVLGAAMHLTPQHTWEPLVGASLNLKLAAFFAEAALFYALAAAFRKHGVNIYLGTAMACGAIWQLLQYWHVGAEFYTLIFALLGLGLLVCYRLAMLEWTGLVDAAFQCANALLSLSFVAACFITLSRLAVNPSAIHWSLVFLLLALAALSLLAAWLVKLESCRRWYVVLAIAEAGLMFITLNTLSQLTLWNKLEIFCITVGIALLVIGHIGWHREDDQQNDLVSFSLLFGSLLVGLPLLIAVLYHRCRAMPEFSTLNELGMLTAGLVLLATGFVLQIRATTITGASMLLVYLISLLLFINMPENVHRAAIWMVIGGGTIVTTGILLSIYRDRLLTLPDRIQRREGVFRVLSWR